MANSAVCGLSDELWACEEIAKEQPLMRETNDKRRYGKTVTIVEGLDVGDIDINELARMLKDRCVAGGSAKEGRIELRGEHRRRVQRALEGMGYRVQVV